MQGHRSPLPFVTDLDLEAQDVAKLALKRLEVGVDYLRSVAATLKVGARSSARLLAPRAFLRLANRIAPGDDLESQFFGIVCARDRPSMTHADIAFQ